MNTKNQTSKVKEVKENSFGWMINMLASSIRILLTKELAKIDLKPNHFKILMTLLNEQGINQAQIGRKIAMPGYATTRSIDQLETIGLLVRKANKKSRRSHFIYLTRKGINIAPNLFSVIEKVNAEFLFPIDKQEKDKLIEILNKLM